MSSTGFVTQGVQFYSTTTSLSSSPNPSKYGQAVTIKATVKSAGANTPTGKVVFKDGSTWIGAANLSGGVATIIKSSLAVGTHSITGAYRYANRFCVHRNSRFLAGR
jgi:Bacterial Ig-like domain (group 3)